MNSYEIIEYIAKAKKVTPIKVYLKGDLKDISFDEYYGDDKSGVLFCELDEFKNFLEKNTEKIEKYRIEMDRRNSAIPLLDLKKINARIEPGAIIRDLVEIGDNAVIMMGAVINIGAKIGKKTMIDMNVVVGGRAQIGENCHIGAGSVIAGVIEPPSAEPVVIDDDVLIGANAVILEGVKIGKGAVVAAGSVVTKNIDPYTVVAGVPAKVIKKVDEKTKDKTKLLDELRNL
ncbi:2,3,4,5-tetrahydropyridine-2,6-dicarboxylate N-acetyltransferase [Marinitoga hydrogenitolerans DSM 16785]|uniref:2,3,4,5-tetrahydropyridine-2,6-dicarboxylate N-acetyltransferase n=1 Tax=Marinitoga hydrogenitolerans (strain DSM 16785 / JCM 12826 / AT1271) TaxID=1122195 RepID=A0A1M4WQ12_MARH1|nr:2,3,4,5-tetrahydropyridine-2,6-dicarboxylate N-acetyltransferase [Marinitoga hydrogenitolerans]SHE83153.1 2,3,4,5-tetrahydropyridine-2,6-dicarboxylate N-acetyltransferase [Marinitoga hydrogenitolerans DSM 16785]